MTPLTLLNRLVGLSVLIQIFISTSLIAQSPGDIAWEAQLAGDVRGAPAIDEDGNYYIGCRITINNTYSGRLYKIDPQGNILWQYNTTDWIDGSPVIDDAGTQGNTNDDRVYITSWDSYLHALDLDGNPLWAFPTSSILVNSPAIAVDRSVYLAGIDGFLYAINPDGTEAWATFIGDDFRASPAIASDGTIYIGCVDGYFYAYNPDGSLKWEFATEDNFPTTGLVNEIASSACIDSDDNIYFGCANGHLYSLDSSGTERWSIFTNSEIESSPIISNLDSLYFTSNNGYFYSVDENGFENWVIALGSSRKSSPLIDRDDNVYIAVFDEDTLSGQVSLLYALSDSLLSQPSTLWALAFSDDVLSYPTMDSSGRLIIGSDEDKLHAIETNSLPVDSAWPQFLQNTANRSRASNGIAPSLDALPALVETQEGLSISLKASAGGTGPLFYNWYQDGQKIAAQTTDTLSLEAISDSTVGQYTVTVFNESGSATSDPIIIAYTEPLDYQSTPEEALVYRYALPSAIAGNTVSVVSSEDLLNWDTVGIGNVLETVSTTTRYEMIVPIGEATRLFLQLEPSASPQ